MGTFYSMCPETLTDLYNSFFSGKSPVVNMQQQQTCHGSVSLSLPFSRSLSLSHSRSLSRARALSIHLQFCFQLTETVFVFFGGKIVFSFCRQDCFFYLYIVLFLVNSQQGGWLHHGHLYLYVIYMYIHMYLCIHTYIYMYTQ